MKPIFVGGCPRSGTTLLGAVLGAHSHCLAVPESQFKIEALMSKGMPNGDRAVLAARERILDSWRFRAWGVTGDKDPKTRPPAANSYPAMVEQLVTQYGQRVGSTDFEMWVDHTPENIYHLATLFNAFPDAKAIHIVRDGRAVAASVIPLDWGPNTMFGAARYWVENVSYGLAAESRFGTERVIQIRYEDLVRGPEEATRRLCAWLHLKYEDSMADAGGYTKPAYYTYRAHNLIGKRPDPSRARAWEAELAPRDIEIFEAATGEFLPYLGYELRYGLKARKITGKETVRSMAAELYREIANRIRGRRRIRANVQSSK